MVCRRPPARRGRVHWLGSALVARCAIGTAAGGATAVGVTLILLSVLSGAPAAVCVLFVGWGLVWGFAPLALQTWLLTAGADAPQASATVLITVMQLSIALGSALGGVLINAHGVATVFVVGGGFAILAGLLAAGLGRRRTPKAG